MNDDWCNICGAYGNVHDAYKHNIRRAREWEESERKYGSLPDILSDEEVLERYWFHAQKMSES